MNPSDIPRIVKGGHTAATELERLGGDLLKATYDWQSPLRSGGAKGPKGQHADPTPGTALDPDPLALEHDALVAQIEAFEKAGANLASTLRRLAPLREEDVKRGRVNSVPMCLACDGPAPRCRRGLCDSCYTAWLRDDRPDMHSFRQDRLAVPPGNERVDPTDLRIRVS